MAEAEYVELIDKYLVTRDESGTPSYKWTDNTGEVVRCKVCKYDGKCMLQSFVESEGVKPIDRQTWFCADGKKRGDAE